MIFLEIRKGSEVKRIIYNNKIQGVVLENHEELKADYVVCNADPPAVYDKLLNQVSNNTIFNW
jgi:phytoene desaturase